MLHYVTVKNSRKNGALAFYRAVYDQNWAKIRENPLFSLKSRYLRNAFFDSTPGRNMLETWNLDQLQKIMIQKIARDHFFKISIFWRFLTPHAAKITLFGHQGVKKRQKMKILKKWSLAIFCIIIFYNWSKFHVSSTFLPGVESKNVFLRYRNFSKIKGISLILAQFWTYTAQ